MLDQPKNRQREASRAFFECFCLFAHIRGERKGRSTINNNQSSNLPIRQQSPNHPITKSLDSPESPEGEGRVLVYQQEEICLHADEPPEDADAEFVQSLWVAPGDENREPRDHRRHPPRDA